MANKNIGKSKKRAENKLINRFISAYNTPLKGDYNPFIFQATDYEFIEHHELQHPTILISQNQLL